MRLLLSVTTICGCMLMANGQNFHLVGAKSTALNHASVALKTPEAFFHNSAISSRFEKTTFVSGYSNPWLLNSFQNQFLAAYIPGEKGAWSAGFRIQGDNDFLLHKTGFGYALKLNQRFSIGVQCHLLGLHLSNGYGRKLTAVADAGILVKLTEKLSLGTSVQNIGRSSISRELNERFATQMRIGIQYDVSKKVKLLSELRKTDQSSPNLNFGLLYQWNDKWAFSCGTGFLPSSFAFGFNLKLKQIRVYFASSYQAPFGWTPAITLALEL